MAKKKPTKRPRRVKSPEVDRLEKRLAKEHERLREAEETIDAIRNGHVDALVVQGPEGEQVFTLKGADHRYRQLVETMNEGALMLSPDGTIVYCNARFATLIKMPLERMVGLSLRRFLPERWQHALDALLRVAEGGTAKTEAEVVASDGAFIPVYLSATASWDEEEKLVCVHRDRSLRAEAQPGDDRRRALRRVDHRSGGRGHRRVRPRSAASFAPARRRTSWPAAICCLQPFERVFPLKVAVSNKAAASASSRRRCAASASPASRRR